MFCHATTIGTECFGDGRSVPPTRSHETPSITPVDTVSADHEGLALDPAQHLLERIRLLELTDRVKVVLIDISEYPEDDSWGSGKRFLAHVFTANRVTGTLLIQASNEIRSVGWYRVDNLPSPLTPSAHAVLLEPDGASI